MADDTPVMTHDAPTIAEGQDTRKGCPYPSAIVGNVPGDGMDIPRGCPALNDT